MDFSVSAAECDHVGLLVHNRLNFKRSSDPARFMYYSGGSWVDYPAEVAETMKAGFREGKPLIEARIGSADCVFDFYRMLVVDIGSGSQRSIAWIDVDGKCFFPSAFIDNDDENCPRIEIEIRISENKGSSKGLNLNESKTYNKRKREYLEKENSEGSSSSSNLKRRQVIGNELQSPRWPRMRILSVEERGYWILRDLIASGLEKVEPGAKITTIHQYLRYRPLDKARREVFRNQMEVMKRARGNCNMVFAWYGTSAEGVEGIFTHGFGMPSKVPDPKGYGIGVYLSPVRSPQNSALVSDIDENGEKHVVLCRVLLGKCEKVEAGSQQSYPSSIEYDTGVDDLENPNWYVVWCANMNTRIIPECVVSYRPAYPRLGQVHGVLPENGLPAGSSVMTAKFFSKLKSSLPVPKIQELQFLWDSYRVGKVAKNAFTKELRSVVGDDLLRSTLREIFG